jgi:hypothetical protein
MKSLTTTALTSAIAAAMAITAGLCTPINFASARDSVAPVATVAAVEEIKAGKADKPVKQPLVQLAILIDTSNSMDGLIAQAKQQLWRIVNEFIAVKRDGQRPLVQVALFEYGNDRLPASEGHILQVLPLTDDLDKVSEKLFALKTNGGQEYCGQVIQAAVDRLKWSKSNDDLKVVFIAGNEAFTQGPVNYAKSCKKAISKGIQINTIFCGNAAAGINGKWKDGAVLADGSYTSIDHNARIVDIKTPYDKPLATLGVDMNKTFVPYGKQGKEGFANQARQDSNSSGVSLSNLAQRSVAKGSSNYRNDSWCLVDAVSLKNIDIAKIKTEDLPENMRKMTLAEKKKYIGEMKTKRDTINKKIMALNKQRQTYIAAEQKKLAEKGEETFDKAVVDSVRKQAEAKKFKFEK